MSQAFDPAAMIQRFADRAIAVKHRQLPPVEGEARKDFIKQASVDFQDFAMVGDSEASLDDGILTLRTDLRPAEG